MAEYRKYYRNQVLPGMSEGATDQMKGLPLPPMQKPYPADADLVDLVAPGDTALGQASLIQAIDNRRSRRKYTGEPLTLKELSFLLWCTQGVQKLVRNGLLTLLTVPSGGCMHPFETYLVVNRVDGLEPGLYCYLALEHKLYPVDLRQRNWPGLVGEASNGQTFMGKGAVIFIWSVRPYRTEWRYGDDSLKDVLKGLENWRVGGLPSNTPKRPRSGVEPHGKDNDADTNDDCQENDQGNGNPPTAIDDPFRLFVCLSAHSPAPPGPSYHNAGRRAIFATLRILPAGTVAGRAAAPRRASPPSLS